MVESIVRRKNNGMKGVLECEVETTPNNEDHDFIMTGTFDSEEPFEITVKYISDVYHAQVIFRDEKFDVEYDPRNERDGTAQKILNICAQKTNNSQE